jgi:hypothetical protein
VFPERLEQGAIFGLFVLAGTVRALHGYRLCKQMCNYRDPHCGRGRNYARFMILHEAHLWTEVGALSLRDLSTPKAPEYAAREARDWLSSDAQEFDSFARIC